ncbi:YiaA/YiaB family inner membrane protein [Myxococcus sp. MISCRS1]|jgi:hypothetical protein|uniref:YiaAB two helix domain-containing protein n=1 Tax=Myxococcus fulvus TaxID=33 RepID=A0A511T214_MYXFU|nr:MULTISPECIES: YiaA/YiaB family inner membrane protein [Myxococcus]BDT30824.1 YiaA/YiaB family inner membrane protein [Myxococcus sp. MH1]MBZ4395474.1 hypothetical protein [Myxococcus sp. AS-1-15]MBZ4411937.1 hypothetical protein [Myxococcus sp. XM-1-1-1]MCK8499218.1 hypothetical protein [Myxococcus fulvus]MCY0999173.1 YiaA/YiaB family inner membrane protein [Myxococcus sp. MISCRS1]
MSRSTPKVVVAHSSAWVIQTWLSFALSVGVTAIGIWHLPVDTWVKSFMAMGLLFSVGSAFSLSKTVRDQHEMEQLGARLDEARVAKMLSEHDPIAPPKL